MAVERHYTHSIVSYATEAELKPLLEKARAWAYILHDKDDGKAPHFHAVVTFATEKSFKWVREQVKSEQNTFTEAIKGELSDVIDYFTHKGITEKYHYNDDDIKYHNRDYWKRRLNNGDDEENKNELFLDDLLSANYSAEGMARKYGRDFIKNFKSYNTFREVVFEERRATALLNMDGVPEDVETSTGLVTSRHAVLSEAEYQLLQELRLNNNTIQKRR